MIRHFLAWLVCSMSVALAQPTIDRRALPDTIPNAEQSSTIILSSDTATLTRATHVLAAESGTADDLATVTTAAFQVGDAITVSADAGDTITIKHGIGNITTDTGADLVLAGAKRATLYVTASGVDASLGGGDGVSGEPLESVADIAALKALPTGPFASGGAVLVRQARRGGVFQWDGSDLSAAMISRSAAIESVNTTSEQITIVAHGFKTGDVVIASTTEAGLTASTKYYVRRVSADVFTLHATYADARANISLVDITAPTAQTIKRLTDPAEALYVVPDGAAPDGSTGAWVRQFDGPLNIRWWNPTADGIISTNSGTDDSEPLQRALDVLALHPNRRFRGACLNLIGGDVYHTNYGLVVEYPGYGFATNKLCLSADATSDDWGAVIDLDDASADSTLLTLRDSEAFEIHNVSLSGSGRGTAGSKVLFVTDENADTDLKISFSAIRDAETGIHYEGRGLTATHNSFSNVKVGVDLDWPNPFTPGGNKNQTQQTGFRAIRISDNRGHFGAADAVFVRNRGAQAHWIVDLEVSRNKIDNGGGLFDGHCRSCNLSFNQIVGGESTVPIIEIPADINGLGGIVNRNVKIVGNDFMGLRDTAGATNFDEFSSGIQVANASGVTIIANTLDRVNGHGIRLDSVSNFEVSYNDLRDVALSEGTTRPIFMASNTHTNGRIAYNRLEWTGTPATVNEMVEHDGATLTNVEIGHQFVDTTKWDITSGGQFFCLDGDCDSKLRASADDEVRLQVSGAEILRANSVGLALGNGIGSGSASAPLHLRDSGAVPLRIHRDASTGGMQTRYTNDAGSAGYIFTPTGANAGNMTPSADNSIDLGSAAASWKDVHVDGAMFVNGATIRAGTGAPEGAVTGNVGDIWLRKDGGAGTTLCVKESGTGNTGWVCK